MSKSFFWAYFKQCQPANCHIVLQTKVFWECDEWSICICWFHFLPAQEESSSVPPEATVSCEFLYLKQLPLQLRDVVSVWPVFMHCLHGGPSDIPNAIQNHSMKHSSSMLRFFSAVGFLKGAVGLGSPKSTSFAEHCWHLISTPGRSNWQGIYSGTFLLARNRIAFSALENLRQADFLSFYKVLAGK